MASGLPLGPNCALGLKARGEYKSKLCRCGNPKTKPSDASRRDAQWAVFCRENGQKNNVNSENFTVKNSLKIKKI